MTDGTAPRWEQLFRDALGLFDQARELGAAPNRWTFGGGTALMLSIGHRESHDIDIFIDDPQLLSYLAPVEDRYRFSTAPTGYQTDGANALRIAFVHGETTSRAPEDRAGAVMAVLTSPTPKRVVDADAPCGTTAALEACGCAAPPTQNSHALLLERVGACP